MCLIQRFGADLRLHQGKIKTVWYFGKFVKPYFSRLLNLILSLYPSADIESVSYFRLPRIIWKWETSNKWFVRRPSDGSTKYAKTQSVHGQPAKHKSTNQTNTKKKSIRNIILQLMATFVISRIHSSPHNTGSKIAIDWMRTKTKYYNWKTQFW